MGYERNAGRFFLLESSVGDWEEISTNFAFCQAIYVLSDSLFHALVVKGGANHAFMSVRHTAAQLAWTKFMMKRCARA
jgi:hypothetical protein